MHSHSDHHVSILLQLFQVVETVVWHCEVDLLSPLSISAVSFMQESSFNVQTRESLHRYKNDTTEEVSALWYGMV